MLILIVFGLATVTLIYSCLVVGSRYDNLLEKSTKSTYDKAEDND